MNFISPLFSIFFIQDTPGKILLEILNRLVQLWARSFFWSAITKSRYHVITFFKIFLFETFPVKFWIDWYRSELDRLRIERVYGGQTLELETRWPRVASHGLYSCCFNVQRRSDHSQRTNPPNFTSPPCARMSLMKSFLDFVNFSPAITNFIPSNHLVAFFLSGALAFKPLKT